ncbi:MULTISPECIES: hypothetical protein [Brucella]|uniref:hypothetical protein n=1 Tax=Brucella TaxID=234 RepID=UPI00188DB3CD|nr:hypothetical protein [Brucella anthropi]MDH0369933.1 hypothetical protein [Brucella anthropi]QPA26425.1 hypothetical protein IR196_00685 [Brucella anthropi]
MPNDDEANIQTQTSLCHQFGRDLLRSQTEAIDELLHDLSGLNSVNSKPEVYVPILMMQAVGVSIHSVLSLTRERDMGIRDCFGIARSAVETALNAAFISASGSAMAEKAVRHMRQKRWRDLRRQGRVGDLKITVSRDVGMSVDDLPGLREALNEYTNRKGDEIRDWTPESLERRLAVISGLHKSAGLCLGGATFAIYRPASELLHGTYYGVNLFWQGSRSEPARRREEFEMLWLTDHFVTLLSALLFGASGAIQVIAFTHSLQRHIKRQDDLLEKLNLLTEKLGELDSDDCHNFHSTSA